MKSNPRLSRFSWALYDFANTIFAINIVSFYFVLWLVVDKGCPELYYSCALGASIFLAGLLMPLIGELSDKLRIRMPFLISFTLGCAIFTAMLGLVNNLILALFIFGLANLCYQLAQVAYDSLLVQVSTSKTLGQTSGLGVSLGYLGTVVGLLLVQPFINLGGRQAAFIPTAVLFIVFALPAFIFIKDLPHPHIPRMELGIKAVFLRLGKNLSQLRQERCLFRFLISAFLCLNAVNAIIVFMGVYAQRVMNFRDTEIVSFMIVSALFARAGSYTFGYCTDRWGGKKTLNFVLKLWCLTIFLAGIATLRWLFWMVGPLAGICLGGTWVTARTLLVEFSPAEKIGQRFGLFGLAARLSAIVGPVVWGIITSWALASFGVFKYRIAIASLLIFMFSGYLVFQAVPDPRKDGENYFSQPEA